MAIVLIVVACCVPLVAVFRLNGAEREATQERLLEQWGGFSHGANAQVSWRLVTGPFIHFSLLHLIYTVSSLVWSLGMLSFLRGQSLAVVCFLSSAVGASACSDSWARRRGSPRVRIGASGGLCGVWSALIIQDLFTSDGSLAAGLAILLAATLGIGLLPGVDNMAHAGGALVGAAWGVLIAVLPGPTLESVFSKPLRPSLFGPMGPVDQVVAIGLLVMLWLWVRGQRARPHRS